MRALFLKHHDFKENSEIIIKNEDFHHLKNVLRIKVDEEILLLNGLGESCLSQVSIINRNDLIVRTGKIKKTPINSKIDLALSFIKKDALTEAIKKTVECGYGRVHLFESDYSQKQALKSEKLQKILKSSYEQSNSKYELEINEFKSFKEIDLSQYETIILFNSVSNEDEKLTKKVNGKCLVVIGPEGGFSQQEITLFRKLDKLIEIYAGTNIMRSPTACSYAMGHVQSLLNMRI